MSEVSEKSLIQSISQNKDRGRRYAFLLGAGASIQSGIVGASTLAKKWLEEIQKNDSEQYKTITENNNFNANNLAASYTDIYRARFQDFPEDGYREIEELMSDDRVQPSLGYTVLAQVLTNTRHNVVLTTNFDRLTETALLTYTNTHARVIAHEEMLNLIAIHDQKPSIVKIHRDMQFSPMSDADEVEELNSKWNDIIRTLLEQYSLICLGYGGNDNGLMNILKKEMKTVQQAKVYWCYRGEATENVQALSSEHKQKFKLVKTAGFDEFMLELNQVLDYKTLEERIQSIAEERLKQYQTQLKKLTENSQNNSNSEAIKELLAKTWYEVQLKINKEPDLDKKDMLFKWGLEQFPKSHELIGNYALFLKSDKKDYEHAEKYYLKAIELDPNHVNNIGNYATFLSDIKKDFEQAEKYYLKAIELDPNNATHIGNYANFLADVKKDYEQAEKYYLKSIELDPNDATHIGNYGIHLDCHKKEYDKAEKYYLKSLELDPNYSNIISNYANLLLQKGKLKKATPYIEAAEKDATDAALKLELAFYRIALYSDHYKENRALIDKLLAEGHTSPGWDFSGVIAQAEEQGRDNIDELKQLAEQISNGKNNKQKK
ncbi:tetratricopeptide repeat protein [Pseudoalteromonas spongiae]|uniref:Tetratricopeptide repeat protein n=1 Tax=Pseudoalteromonas spongiae TaxID=298657 RepID=A0ABU8EW60_9GAMM